MTSSAKDFPISHPHSSQISTLESPSWFRGPAHKLLFSGTPSAWLQATFLLAHLFLSTSQSWTLLPEALGQKPAFLAHPFFLSLQTLELGLDRIVRRFTFLAAPSLSFAAPSGPTGSCCSIYRKKGRGNENVLKR